MPHSQQEAEATFSPYMEPLSMIFPRAWQGWEDYGRLLPERRLQTSLRSRASLLNDFAAAAAEEIFADYPEVVLTDQPGFLLMIFDSKLHLRLKKYKGRTCQTSGIPTDQRNLFENQQPLTGFPEATNCVHGYLLKSDASYFAETAIKCSVGERLLWKIDVPLGDEGEGRVVEHRPAPSGPLPEPGISSTIEDQDQAEEGGISG
jgi:hypothetical protein